MIRDLTRLANVLDQKGLRKEADCLDVIIRKLATDAKQRILSRMGLGQPLSETQKLQRRKRLAGIQERLGETAEWLATNYQISKENKYPIIADKEYLYSLGQFDLEELVIPEGTIFNDAETSVGAPGFGELPSIHEIYEQNKDATDYRRGAYGFSWSERMMGSIGPNAVQGWGGDPWDQKLSL